MYIEREREKERERVKKCEDGQLLKKDKKFNKNVSVRDLQLFTTFE